MNTHALFTFTYGLIPEKDMDYPENKETVKRYELFHVLFVYTVSKCELCPPLFSIT